PLRVGRGQGESRGRSLQKVGGRGTQSLLQVGARKESGEGCRFRLFHLNRSVERAFLHLSSAFACILPTLPDEKKHNSRDHFPRHSGWDVPSQPLLLRWETAFSARESGEAICWNFSKKSCSVVSFASPLGM